MRGKPRLTSTFEQRFRREAKLLTELKHPHIIPVEDAWKAEDYAYLVMPFLQVGTLTDVPPIDPCAGLISAGFMVNGSEVRWEIVNGGLSGVSISRILLDWPAANLELKKVRLAGSQIWNAVDDAPATDIQSGWKGNRSLAAGAAKELSFEFGPAAASSGYELLVEFDNGCQIETGG